jgi:hypothetical protein
MQPSLGPPFPRGVTTTSPASASMVAANRPYHITSRTHSRWDVCDGGDAGSHNTTTKAAKGGMHQLQPSQVLHTQTLQQVRET